MYISRQNEIDMCIQYIYIFTYGVFVVISKVVCLYPYLGMMMIEFAIFFTWVKITT